MAEEHKEDLDAGISYNESSNAIQRLLDKLQKRPRQGGMMEILGRDQSDKLSNGSISNLDSILKDLIEFKDPNDPRHPIGATVGALTIPGYAQTAVGIGTIAGATGLKDRPVLKGDRPIMANLKKEAKSLKYPIRESYNPLAPAQMIPHDIKVPTLGVVREKGIEIYPGVRSNLKPGLLAHEIGHASQPKWLNKYSWPHQLGKFGSAAGSLYPAFTKDEQKAKTGAIAGTVASVPMLANELHASIKGSSILKKAGMKGIRRATPFVGLPSYAAVAALPGATYAVKKKLGGYRSPEDKLSSILDGLIEFQHPMPVVKSAWRKWNKVPPGKFMEKTKLVKEHEHLVGVLKSHNSTAINHERVKQAGELKEYKKLSSVLDDLIQLQGDPRPRNNLGEFTDQSQGGPNPNSMYKTYTIAPQTPGMSPNKSMISPDTKKLATVALLGGAAGTLGSEAVKGTGYAIKSLAGKLRSKLRK